MEAVADNVVDHVVIQIDYAIIEHFSRHLYGSPSKAIEELVSNSFDALATKAFVYIPGRLTNHCVLVWDNGDSMDMDGLHKLWWIAQSPKDVGDRRVQAADGRVRLMIGKFGIGKLASYAVGHKITHLCRKGGRFLKVSVDYRDVPHITDNAPSEPYTVPIVELNEDEAKQYVAALFTDPPEGIAPLWDDTCWTLAIIDELKPDVQLSEGRLAWIIGNGMPLRPDFRVWVNDKEVVPRLEKDAVVSWDLSEPKLLTALSSAWKSARDKGEVDGEYQVIAPSQETDNRPSIGFPSLGIVQAEVRLFDRSLLDRRSQDSPRSHGFFAMVRNRLLNHDDELLFLPAPSYGTFYRCQFVIWADGLDQDLLANRERLHLNTPRTRELAVLQQALYLAARNELTDRDERAEDARRSESLLPIGSREHFREPLIALQLRHADTISSLLDHTKVRIERASLNDTEPMAIFSADGSFKVNTSHPLLQAVREKLGDGKKAQDALQAFDLFAISERLFEGYLYNFGLPAEQIDEIVSWRDNLFRAFSARFVVAPSEEVIREVRDSSYLGSKPFETALAKLFRLMGFVADRDGIPGRKDVLVVAPIGQDEYKLTVEAKGSKHAVANDAAEIGGANSHRKEAGAKLAIVVAREFAGFERPTSEKPAILKECEAAEGVSIVTVEVLEELYKAIQQYCYPLDLILPVLGEIESPKDKLERVRNLQHPTEGFDYRGVLEEVWNRQQGEAAGDFVAYRSVWQSRPDRWGIAELEDFERRLVAIETLAGIGLVQVLNKNQVITIRQHPDIVIKSIMQAVDRTA